MKLDADTLLSVLLDDHAAITPLVHRILSQGSSNPVVQRWYESEELDKVEIRTRLKKLHTKRRALDAIGLGPMDQKKDLSRVCTWVPSVSGHRFPCRFVYGGVRVSPKVHQWEKHDKRAQRLAHKIQTHPRTRHINGADIARQTFRAANTIPKSQPTTSVAQQSRFYQAQQEAKRTARTSQQRKATPTASDLRSSLNSSTRPSSSSSTGSNHASTSSNTAGSNHASTSSNTGQHYQNQNRFFDQRYTQHHASSSNNTSSRSHNNAPPPASGNGGNRQPPSGGGGNGRPPGGWTVKARLKAVQLPNEGRIRFVPPDKYKPTLPLPKAPDGNGYRDKFGNIWKKGPSRTKGQAFEWDVQLSKTGQLHFKWLKGNLSHLNVSLDGRITHLSR